MESELVDRDGKIFVLDAWRNHFSQPIKFRLLWGTGLNTLDHKNMVGKKAYYYADGVYRLESGLCLRLENGGETKPDDRYTEERRIPRPPGMHEYKNGRWRL